MLGVRIDDDRKALEKAGRDLLGHADAKCPKLASWAREGRTSILVIEADDIQHSNAFVVYKAVARALRVATEIDPRQANRVPSTKGMLV